MRNLATSVPRPRGLLVASIFLAAVVSLAAAAANVASNSFRSVYAGLGAELPPLTRTVGSGLWVWALLAFAGVCTAVWVASTPVAPRETYSRLWTAVVTLAIVAGLAMAVSIVAVYLPLFRLGSVI